MGNYASCTLGGGHVKRKRAIKVIFPTGEVKNFNQPITAAELMLEIPSYFVVNSTSLLMGKRITAVNAEVDLKIGDVYVMLPMHRVNSLVTAADMAALYLAATRGGGRAARSSVRVVPACGGDVEVARGVEEVAVVVVGEAARGVEGGETKAVLEGVEEEVVLELRRRRSVSRSRKPLLETIVEEPGSRY